MQDGFLLEQAGLKKILTPAKEEEETDEWSVSDRQLGNTPNGCRDIKQKFGDSGAGRWDGAAAADPFFRLKRLHILIKNPVCTGFIPICIR